MLRGSRAISSFSINFQKKNIFNKRNGLDGEKPETRFTSVERKNNINKLAKQIANGQMGEKKREKSERE